MKLSPVNIKRQEFSKAVRGYSIGEVNDFLEKVAEEVESALKENETLRRTVDHLNLDIERYKTIEGSGYCKPAKNGSQGRQRSGCEVVGSISC